METIYIKNMVCPQCIKMVKSIFNAIGATEASVHLGYVDLVPKVEYKYLDEMLESEGFQRLVD